MSDENHRRLARNPHMIGAVRFLFAFHLISAVLIPFFRDWGGMNYTQIFALNAWFMVCVFLFEIPTGSVADRFGRKASLVLAGLVSAAGALVMVSTASFETFVIGETLLALGLALQSGADQALLYDTLVRLGREAEARRQFARLESLKLAGITLGAVAGSPLAAAYGLTAPMWLQALPFMACSVLALGLYEVPHADGHEQRSMRHLLFAGVRALRDNAPVRALTLDGVATHALAFMVIWLYQPLLERAGVELVWFGLVHAALALVQIAVLSWIERFESLAGSPRRYLRLSAIVPGAAFVAMGLSDALSAVLVGVLSAGAFGLTRVPLITAYMNRHIASRERATVLSTAAMLRTLGIAAVQLVVGVLMDQSIDTALYALGAAALLAAALGGVRADYLQDAEDAEDGVLKPR